MADKSVLDLNKKWFAVPLPTKKCSLKDIANSSTSKEDMDKFFLQAQEVLEKEKGKSQMDRGRWYSTQFLSRGTTSDRIASAAVKLSDTDFMFFLEGFNLLFDTARADTHHYEAALKALAAVWPRVLPTRPLKRFISQYFATLPEEEPERSKVLLYWYLEDYLKRTYAQFLSLCESMLKDRIVQRREAWLELVGKLMCTVTEGRSTAMAMVIDKLGDPSSQVAHKAYHHLLTLLSESSTHQQALFTELEKIIFMKNCPLRTMRYAANVMNQLVYSKDERKLAIKAVQTYLSLFRQLVLTHKADSTVTTAIIIGLRRAFPYSGTDIGPLSEHLNALFILANTGTFQQRVSTLSLLELLAHNKGTPESFQDRWYRTLYQLLLFSPKSLPQSSQLTNFFTLLHKAMRQDKRVERVAAFVHRLLQRTVYYNDAMVCAVLLLVGEMSQAHPTIRQMIQASPATLKKTAPATKGGKVVEEYDPKARDPQFARATRECLWVLNLLSRHSHPSVVRLSILLLFGKEIVFDSHPLDDMTPSNFLQMFVDAKASIKKEDDKRTTGMAVFRRTTNAPVIPSASDPYFINANAQEVEVNALFLHRYAIQRQRFLDSLAQVKPTWGDVAGEEDAAARVAKLDTALFGPDGQLDMTKELDDDGTVMTKEKGEAKTTTKSDDEDESVSEDFADYDILQDGEDGLDWGGDEDVDHLDEDTDEEFNEADEEEGEEGLSRHKDEFDDGDDFGEIIEEQKKELSKKRKREEQWLDQRSSSGNNRFSNRPGRFQNNERGNNRGSFTNKRRKF